ncbi:uncharacterized protein LOC124303087 isoform X1 [Neodiprion virginianus]|uniref:uncharacterized protein LOC124303087 isoform X1 n=2 Tax=Neodiprion virginianus TaxID=2961670 RepID=UPI001EE7024C|nr:uncharacterized protein LOC124303087 isoform X1 [Neodiprion virginianus]
MIWTSEGAANVLTMHQAVIETWAVSCLLAIYIGPLSGSPVRTYWTPQQAGKVVKYPQTGKDYPAHINYGAEYRGSLKSQFESNDPFQLEQWRQSRNHPAQSKEYDYGDKYANWFRKDQKSYYQSLSQVTENPSGKVQDEERFSALPGTHSYYQDYLPLDVEEADPDSKEYDTKKIIGEVDPSNVQDEIDRKVKNSTTEKIASLITKMLLKEDSYVPSLSELDILNSLEGKIIAKTTDREEIKRGVRQVSSQQKPGVVLTLARLAFEKVNDTKSAVNQIGAIVNSNLSPDVSSTSRPSTTSSATTSVTGTLIDANTTMTTTTTEAPFVLTRSELLGIIRRNLRGLVRLFNIEWREALSQSQVSVRDFQRDLGNQIRPYLEDNPNVN